MFPLFYRDVYKAPADYQPPAARNLADDVYYSNLNSTDYAARPQNYSLRMLNAWDCIARNDKGHIAIATNKRDGREWWGAFFGFDQHEKLELKTANYARYSAELITKLAYAGDNILLVGLVDGRLQAWSLDASEQSAEPNSVYQIADRTVDQDYINNLRTCKANPNQAISTNNNQSLSIWSVTNEDLMVLQTVKRAHNASITGIDTSRVADAVFATCASDGVVKLWDTREVRPATLVYTNNEHVFTSLAYAIPTEGAAGDNLIYLGDFDGKVHSLDVRAPGQLQESEAYFKNSCVSQIHVDGAKLAVVGARPGHLKITNASDHSLIYEYKAESAQEGITDAVWNDAQTLLTVNSIRKFHVHKF